MTRIVLFALTVFAGAHAAYSVSIQSNLAVVTSSIEPSGFLQEIFVGTTIPTDSPLEASNSEFFSINQISYTESASQVIFSNTLSQNRPGYPGAIASASNGSLAFTVDTLSTYQIAGFFTITDAGIDSGRRVVLSSSLYDDTNDETSFENTQESYSQLNEMFVLGESNGDTINSLTGSLSPGVLYQWNWNALTQAFGGSDEGASGSGNLTLTITSVPDSGSTLTLLAFGLVGMAALKRLRTDKLIGFKL